MQADYESFLPMGSKDAKASKIDANALFSNYSRGVATSRDDWAYDFGAKSLATKMQRLIDTYNSEVDRWKRRTDEAASVDEFVKYDDTSIKWSRDLKLDLQRGKYADFAARKIRTSMYRPFTKQYLFFDRVINEEVYVFPRFFPTAESEAENLVICVVNEEQIPFSAQVTNYIP